MPCTKRYATEHTEDRAETETNTAADGPPVENLAKLHKPKRASYIGRCASVKPVARRAYPARRRGANTVATLKIGSKRIAFTNTKE